MIAKVHGDREELPRHERPAHRGRGARTGRRPRSPIDDTVAQIDHWLATPIADDPLLHTAEPTGVADADDWRAPAPARRRDRRPARDGGLPRHDPRPGPAPCPRRRTRRADVARGRRGRLRPDGPLPHDPRALSAQEIHDIGLQQIAKLAGGVPRAGPRGPRDERRAGDLPAASRRPGPPPHEWRRHRRRVEGRTRQGDAAMGGWFGIVPRAGCDVEEVQSGAIAFYFPPAKDGSAGRASSS